MRVIAAVLGALLALTSASVRADELQVTVASGALSGLASRDGLVRSFKGVPYAAPPVGSLRWRPPEPVAAWQGTREANRFSPICPQPSPIPGAFYQREFFQTAEAQSEDCLYLNVWTAVPRGAAPRPVMVFFHSGGNSLWSGSMMVFDGSDLARKGAVVVTLNFRIGAFGFLAHPELDAESPDHVSGNYGLLDQQAALRWVKANIAAFGGDPERITIFGQSAGATDVGYAMASPLVKGLFRRAIIESSQIFGTLGPTPNLASAEEGGKKLVSGASRHAGRADRGAYWPQIRGLWASTGD
ncbi:MAG TPA: carboxylesterase family protein [Acetobacteraceae bacterium]|nr:carboxylesterase family protein [Acetobacteraceae bacterium]